MKDCGNADRKCWQDFEAVKLFFYIMEQVLGNISY